MRTHSGLHVLCGVVFRDFGALVTGGNGGLGRALALGLAALGLFGGSLRERLPAALLRPVIGAVNALRQLHSGHIGDYIAWQIVGAAVLGGVMVLTAL